jgi:hypothetical protein
MDGRDAIWGHPDLLPSAEDLDDPLAWAEQGPDDSFDLSALDPPSEEDEPEG